MSSEKWGTSIDTAVILGAGASKNYKPCEEVNIPGDADFFQKAKEIFPNDFLEKEFEELNAFLGHISPDPFGAKGPRLESVFTLVETYQRWFKFGREGSNLVDQSICTFFPPLPYSSLTPVLNHLIEDDLCKFPQKYFAYDTSRLVNHQADLASKIAPNVDKGKIQESFSMLKHKIYIINLQLSYLVYLVLRSYANQDGTYRTCGRHKSLFQKVLKNNNGMAVLSFNYDLVGDASLAEVLKERGWNWNPETFYFQLFDPTPRIQRDPDVTNKDIFLLKLHGSVNWYLPLGEDKQFICGEMHGIGPRILSQTEAAAKSLEPVIVPPLMDKFLQFQGPGKTGHFGRSWAVAFDSLIKAKKWIFVGYSLPPADFHATWLFQTASAYRRSSPPEIEIINPDKNTCLKNMLIAQGFKIGGEPDDLKYLD